MDRHAVVRIALALLVLPCAVALAEPDDGGSSSKPHDPRLELSYRRFAVNNLDGTPVWLDGAQLDVYAVSRPFVRGGLELEGGAGKATLDGGTASVGYGLLGATVGVQYPARVTPFLAGRFAGGVLGGTLQNALSVAPGVTVNSGQSGATYIYGGGLDAGFDFFTVGRSYLSASVGWVRTTWRGVDEAAMLKNPQGGMVGKDITGDSFTFKLGIGI